MIVRNLLTLLSFKSDEKDLRSYDRALQTVISGVKILAIGTAALGGVFLKGAGDIEQVSIAFETMLGSGEAAQKLLQEITDFAEKTPFELTGLIQSSKKLLAFGFSAEEIIETMTNLGNVAAGIGREKLPTLIMSLGKIRTKGKAGMEELNMMLEAGVPILEKLTKQMGVTRSELFKMIEKNKIGFDDVNEAIRNMSNESGLFSGLMEKQSKSFLGMMSNIQDFLTNLGNAVGKELLPMAKEIASMFLSWAEGSQEVIKQNLVKYFKSVVLGAAAVFFVIKNIALRLKSFVSGIFDAINANINLSEIFETLVDIGSSLIQTVSDIFEEFKIGDAIMESVSLLFKTVGNVINFITDAMKEFEPLFRPIILAAATVFFFFKNIWDRIVGVFNNVLTSLRPVITTIAEALAEIFEKAKGPLSDISERFKSVFEGVGNVIEELAPKISKVLGSIVRHIGRTITTLIDIIALVVAVGDEILHALFADPLMLQIIRIEDPKELEQAATKFLSQVPESERSKKQEELERLYRRKQQKPIGELLQKVLESTGDVAKGVALDLIPTLFGKDSFIKTQAEKEKLTGVKTITNTMIEKQMEEKGQTRDEATREIIKSLSIQPDGTSISDTSKSGFGESIKDKPSTIFDFERAPTFDLQKEDSSALGFGAPITHDNRITNIKTDTIINVTAPEGTNIEGIGDIIKEKIKEHDRGFFDILSQEIIVNAGAVD